MAVLPILLIPDPRLREVCRPVTAFDADLKRFADNMAETMYAAPGIGLAAAQVGDPRRVITVDTAAEGEPSDLVVMVNPEITAATGKIRFEEGCLSIPGFYDEVERPDTVDVRWQDVTGAVHTGRATGLKAVCIQHEIDHLNGRLFIDYLPEARRRAAQDVVNRTLRGETVARRRRRGRSADDVG